MLSGTPRSIWLKTGGQILREYTQDDRPINDFSRFGYLKSKSANRGHCNYPSHKPRLLAFLPNQTILTRQRMLRLTRPILLLFPLLAAGCFGHDQPSLVSPDPSLKIPAIKQSVENRDQRSEAQMVKDLDNDDAAVRFYAIQGLHRLTGRTFGYRYYDDEVQRLPALRKWQAWLAGQSSGRPATNESADEPPTTGESQ